MGIHRATELDGWCVFDLVCLPDEILDSLLKCYISSRIRACGLQPSREVFISLIAKGEGMQPMQQCPVSVLSQLY